MKLHQRFPKLFATMTAVFDGDADQAAQIMDEIEQSGAKLASEDRAGIGGAFKWDETPQGADYWEMMDDKAEQLLGEDYRKADFLDCDCPACKLTLKFGATRDAIGVIANLGMMAVLLPEEMVKEIIDESRAERLAQKAKSMH